MSSRKKFRLNRRDGKIMGVCAGIADYTGIDVTFVRIAIVLVTLLGAFPWTLIAYAVAVWLAKRAPADVLGSDVGGSRRAALTDLSDIDRRMVEIDSYVASSNSRLASEIEQLR